MEIAKQTQQRLSFTGAGCRASVDAQVVIELDVPGGRQAINFPVHQLPAVAALIAGMAADEDVLALIVEHTPEPEPVEPDPEPEPEEPEEPEP